MTTDNTEHIDWQQINRLPAFDIYKLVLLSLGRDCYTNVMHPFGCGVIHGDGIQRPEPDADYTDRLIVAIENARYGRLPTTGETACLTTTRTTTKFQFVGPGGFKVHSDEPEVIPSKFDLYAPPFDAQFWIVDTAEFRRFCDLMEWSAPPEFLPLGYKKPTVPHPLSEIPPGAPVELADDAPVPMADAPAKAPAPLPEALPRHALYKKPEQRRADILAAISKMGFNPMALPPPMPGKQGVKNQIFVSLYKPCGFENDWQKLVSEVKIRYANEVS